MAWNCFLGKKKTNDMLLIISEVKGWQVQEKIDGDMH